MLSPEQISCPYCYGSLFDELFLMDIDSLSVHCVGCDSYLEAHVEDGDLTVTDLEES